MAGKKWNLSFFSLNLECVKPKRDCDKDQPKWTKQLQITRTIILKPGFEWGHTFVVQILNSQRLTKWLIFWFHLTRYNDYSSWFASYFIFSWVLPLPTLILSCATLLFVLERLLSFFLLPAFISVLLNRINMPVWNHSTDSRIFLRLSWANLAG